jgi:tRNA A37 threonylcarbamoyladenosine synthetase subunit TsaC/SUA5/YrdC
VVDGGPAGTVASTVVDATDVRWRILREGSVTEHDLRL